MRFISPKGNEISTLDQWGACVRRVHWKEGRSAYSLAEFILNQNGTDYLVSRISSVLSQQVKLETATPEFRARFDDYRGPSNLDLGTFGRVGSKSSLSVGVEAKVDEPFGDDTVGERYQKAIREHQRNPRSKARERVKGLLSRYFSDPTAPCASRFSGIRYQLLTGTAGTVAAQKDVSVFYVVVFKTREYNEQMGRENREDYEKFIQAAYGKPLPQGSKEIQAHELTLDGKRLICIYDYVDF